MAAQRSSEQAKQLPGRSSAISIHRPVREDDHMDQEHRWKQPNVCLNVGPLNDSFHIT